MSDLTHRLAKERDAALARAEAAEAEVERLRSTYMLATDAKRLNDRYAAARNEVARLRAALAEKSDPDSPDESSRISPESLTSDRGRDRFNRRENF